ncbi:MAG: hypothetical protein H0U72_00035 [Nitrosospira sp.]|nr:hypothetical protein [Nitrosospira sp.]
MTEQKKQVSWFIEEFIAIQPRQPQKLNKLKALKAHKKGLMQQLFPSADEVHG